MDLVIIPSMICKMNGRGLTRPSNMAAHASRKENHCCIQIGECNWRNLVVPMSCFWWNSWFTGWGFHEVAAASSMPRRPPASNRNHHKEAPTDAFLYGE
jgi:hypothetical protein